MHMSFGSRIPAALAALGLLAQQPLFVEGKLVFAHYMVGRVDANTDHARQDIDQAISVGFDAFALNVGRPAEEWAISTVQQLFDYAGGKDGFKLFFSFDMHQEGDINAHRALLDQFRDHPAHLKYGDDNRPVLSSFGGGNLGPDVWRDLRQNAGLYLIPNLESDGNYYNDPAAFFGTWGDAVDGVFSWETAWPETAESPTNVSSVQDEHVKAAADAAGKAYMMGVSPIQYKHCCGDSWYRPGETNLPERFGQVLSVAPEFVEVITWNDAGESHYIGQCWAEGLPEDILEYGNSDKNPHDGWQGLVASFIDAYKNGVQDPEQMKPHGDGAFTGALWYRSATRACSGDVPRGAGAASDAVNYAVVLPSGADGQSLRVSSGGETIAEIGLRAGLNYGSVPGARTGAQKIELLGSDGNIVAEATGKVDVSDSPNEYGFCDYNYFVSGLQ